MRLGSARSRGFTLVEFLVAGAILAIMVALLAPIVAERVRVTKARTTAGQFAIDLRAARWIAVSNRSTIDVTVDVANNEYQYTDAHGRLRKIAMPSGVRIVSSTSPIQFRSNGSVLGGASTVIEADLSNDVISRWTVTTSVIGISRTEHERIKS